MNNVLEVSRTILQTTPQRWVNLTRSLPVDLLNRPPAPNEWSALECLQHIIETEALVFPVRIEALLAGQDFPAFDPDSQGKDSDSQESPEAMAEKLASLRVTNLALFDKLTPADLPSQARHQALGLATLSELLHEWAAHDLNHTVQAERALMQPFIQGCGPWQSYFVDHFVDG